MSSAEQTAAEVLARHHAAVGPISGWWKCPCGEEARSVDDSGLLVTPEDRRAEYRAHLAQTLAAAGVLTTGADEGLRARVEALLADGKSGGYWGAVDGGWVRGIREDAIRAALATTERDRGEGT